jgi:hypothetical protein
MKEQAHVHHVVVITPSGRSINYVVRETKEEISIEAQGHDSVQLAHGPLVLATLVSAVLPAGPAKLRAFQLMREIEAGFDRISLEMANVPDISGDELPF